MFAKKQLDWDHDGVAEDIGTLEDDMLKWRKKTVDKVGIDHFWSRVT